MRKLGDMNVSYSQIGRIFDLTNVQARNIVKRISWAHI